MAGEAWTLVTRDFVSALSALANPGNDRRPPRSFPSVSKFIGALAVAAGLATPALANGAPPMVVPGQFNVSATGAAMYAIPIAVPPGTAGMVPALSLDYSSQSGDGIVGLGWTLSGLPSISRCPRTYSQDNVHGGVNYDSNDRYCMEGQRLVATSGTYGANGTVYGTEIEGFSKIVSYGTAGNGPSYFKVWTKSGQIMEFGNTTDSKILAVGKATVRTWAVNKITDTKGNYLTVTYTNDTVNGQVYPTRIDYTGNANAGLATYNSVQFAYNTSRPDVTPTYQAGSLQQTTVLLTDVKTYQGSNLVYDYKLAYRLGSSTTHSRLTSVTLCDTNGACLAPTTFGWQGGTGALSYSTTSVSVVPGNQSFAVSGDFNGDGLTDLAAVLDGTSSCPSGGSIYDATSSGTYVQANMSMCPGIILGDHNGDGFTDAALDSASGPWSPAFTYIYTNNQQGGFTLSSTIVTGRWTIFGDFNGDGYGFDYVSAGSGNTTAVNSWTGSPYGGTTVTLPTPYVINFAVADFDGDGCNDLLDPYPADTIFFMCNPAVSSMSIPNWNNTNVVIGDFNGDGKSDVLAVPISGTGTLYLSTGTSLTATSFSVPTSWDGKTIVAGDWNGDGKTDIAVVDGSTVTFYLSTGTGFVSATTASISGTFYNAEAADWNSDGAQDIFIKKSSGDAEYLFSYTPELMTSVSNGIGATTTISYDRINKNGSFYTKCSGNPGTYACGDSYPTMGLDGPFYVVSQVDSSNGVGGTYSYTYSYAGAKAGLTGRSFLGFQSVSKTDLQTGIVETTNYRTDFPYVGLVSSQTTTSGSITLNSTTNTFAATNLGSGTDGVMRYFVSLTQSVVASNDLDGSAMPTTTTNYTYDGYGNALTVNVSVSDGSSKNTTNTYNNDTSNWFLGRLTSAQAQSTVGSSVITRTSCFQYDSGTGLLTREVIEPVSTSNCTYSSTGVQTDYTYDSYGHRTQATVSGSGITTRSTTASYDSRGEFQTQACNALNQCESWSYSSQSSQNFGGPTSHTGPDNLTTSWSYDSFGRPTIETRPDGNKTATSYTYCSGVNGGSASCVTYGAFIATVTPQTSGGSQNGPQSIAYYDSLSRGIAGDAQGFDGSWIRSVTQYDGNGRIAQKSRPYFVSGGTAKWTVYTYDALGRATHVAFPNGGYINAAYHGLSVSVTNDHSQTTTTVKNAQGLNASVTDALNHTTSYVYDAEGDLTQITDPSGNVTTDTYSTRGFKTAASDPDMGSWSYVYDVLGELTSQTDAKSQTTTLTYNLLGQITSRTESSLYSVWTYGTSSSSHNVGKIIEAKACTNSGCSAVVSDKTYAYDTYGRPYTATTATGGSNYTYTDNYDSNSHLSTVGYPSGFTAQYVYNSLGYLSQVKDNGSGSTYWTANSRDAELHLLTQTFGNGVGETNTYDANTGFLTNVRAGPSNSVAQFDYTYDTLGNLTYRADGYQGTFEYACYDALNRLTQYAVGNGVSSCSSSQNHKVVAYDAVGNITSKSDVGTYSYPAGGQARPHAVSSITGTVNGVVNPTYTYDANGNMTAGAGRSVTYTSFNMAALIVQGSTTVSFTYDSEHARVIMTAPSGTTTYLNDAGSGAVEEKLVSGGTTTWHDFLMADGHFIAEKFSGGTTAMRYFVLDHLGSIAVVTNESGSVVERDAYDAWGKRRNLDGSDDTTCSLTSLTTRGFTGHEHIPAVCLINANARIYDPTLGRFMTPDSTTEAPFNLQDLNRYSYVLNNPLALTDPTGHFPGVDEIVTVFGTNPVTAPIAFVLDILSTIFGGLFGGGAVTLPATISVMPPGMTPMAASGTPSGLPQPINTAVPSTNFTAMPNMETVIVNGTKATLTQAGQYIGLTATSASAIIAAQNLPPGEFRYHGRLFKVVGKPSPPNCPQCVVMGVKPVPTLGALFSAGAVGTVAAMAVVGVGAAAICAATVVCGAGVVTAAVVSAGIGGTLSGLSAGLEGGVTTPQGMFLTSLTGGIIGGATSGFGEGLGFVGGRAVGLGTLGSFAGGFAGDAAGQYVEAGDVSWASAGRAGFTSAAGYFVGGSFAIDEAGVGALTPQALTTQTITSSAGTAFSFELDKLVEGIGAQPSTPPAH